LILIIDACRKHETNDNDHDDDDDDGDDDGLERILSKVYELRANALCADDQQDHNCPNRHLESIILDEVLKRIAAPCGDLAPASMNALANYYNAVGQCSLESDLVDHLKRQVIFAMGIEDVPKEASTNLLRAMSLVCDFTLSDEEELAIYKVRDVNCVQACINVSQIVFFCRPSRERSEFIAACLNSDNPVCIIE
jgi:hypothetical protein